MRLDEIPATTLSHQSLGEKKKKKACVSVGVLPAFSG